ncbi:MAG TPA: aldo/keto reductase [Mesorhizobium sp.]|uniref:aldo/keto reductase n=1 Tax=Mesorhizobium sp. TaxID=1871066 RepID=UPI002DDD1751|nr:aldo/keto reductase [Mesorhizobium sp.]HEV2504245.1 aldo/keto reductase [Mesorhizobium sp.]
MREHTLGKNGPIVSRLGLGCMGMSDLYGPADRVESLATLHAALDTGITLLDTGDFYGMGHNEMLIAEALATRSNGKVALSVKFGAQRGPDGGWLGFDTRPNAVKTAAAYSLKRLGVEAIDIYRPARLDPNVPIEETIGAIADLVKAGYVKHIGLSEVGSETIRRAAAVHPIADLQIECSLLSRGIEDGILDTCRELGIGITAYGVLSRGLISGHWDRSRATIGTDFRSHSPRFQGNNLDRNLTLVDALRRVAETRGASVAQIAIAWVLAQGNDIVPLIGARRRDRLAEALGALDLVLSASDVAAIEAAAPKGAAAGQRYAEHQMATLDSERAA